MKYIRQVAADERRFLACFEGVDAETCQLACELVPAVRDRARLDILGLIKAAHEKRSEWERFYKRNCMFQICVDGFVRIGVLDHVDDVFKSFDKLKSEQSKRDFLGFILVIDPVLFRNILEMWFESILTFGNIQEAKAYFAVLLAALRDRPEFISILDGNLTSICKGFSIRKICSIFNHFEKNANKVKLPAKVEETLSSHGTRILGAYQFYDTERAWQEHLKVLPVSNFSKQFVRKMLREFDRMVCSASSLNSAPFQATDSSTASPSRRESSYLTELARKADRDSAQGDFDSTRRLAQISRLSTNRKIRAIFQHILSACRTNSSLRRCACKSDLIRFLARFGCRVCSLELSIKEAFLMEHLSLGSLLKLSLIFETKQLFQAGTSFEKSGELLRKESEFDAALAKVKDAISTLRKEELALESITQEQILLSLLGPEQVDWCRGALDQNERLVKISDLLDRASTPVSDLKLEKLGALACPLKWRVFLLFCFRSRYMRVFDDDSRNANQDFESLCRYFGHERDSRRSTANWLSFDKFNSFFEQIDSYQAYLSQKYFQAQSKEPDWETQFSYEIDLPENLLLFEFLRKGTHIKSYANVTSWPPKITRFLTTLSDLKHLQTIKQALSQLPSNLKSTVSRVKPKLARFEQNQLNRLTTLRGLLSKERKLLARIERVGVLARNPQFCDFFSDRLEQEIEAICDDPFGDAGSGSESELSSLDVNNLENLFVGGSGSGLRSMLDSKIKRQQRNIDSLRAQLVQASSRNKVLSDLIGKLEQRNHELFSRNVTLLKQLNDLGKMLSVHIDQPAIFR